MECLRILIADSDVRFSSLLSGMLLQLGHSLAAAVSNGGEAVEKTLSLSPDLAILGPVMKDMDGLEAAKRILERRPLPVVFLGGTGRPELIERAHALGVSWWMQKPGSAAELQLVLSQVWPQFRHLQTLQREIREMKESIRSRKLIERAKGRLMEREGLTEDEAYRRIQRMSRDGNIAMSRIAEAVLMTSGRMSMNIDRERNIPVRCSGTAE